MLVKVILLLELLSVFLCVFRVYGQKPKVDVKGVISFALMYVILSTINQLGLSTVYVAIAYMFLYIFCLLEFKEKTTYTLISVLLCISVVAIMQFISMLMLVFVDINSLHIRTMIGDIIVFICTILLLPHCQLNNLRMAICRRNWLVNFIVVFMIIIIILAIIINNIQQGFDMALFLFSIPATVIILFLVYYWDRTLLSQKRMQKELEVLRKTNNGYEDLIAQVRVNNHGIKNHIMALKTSQYVYKNKEYPVDELIKYCDEVNDKNRYSRLLLLQNQPLVGFLYAKILEIEKKNIFISYKIETDFLNSAMSIYSLIEMLGIIFDNAMEACLEKQNDKKIFFEIKQEKMAYIFLVGNSYPETKYEEIISWFELGKSSKGKKRGIGLYQVKELCKENNCMLSCKNKKIDNENYIVFELIIKKDDIR